MTDVIHAEPASAFSLAPPAKARERGTGSPASKILRDLAPEPPPQGPGRFWQVTKSVLTLLILSAAVVASVVIWKTYVTAPWTRDGRIRVQVSNIAPQVSGQITQVRVADNQFVHKGDVLYVIDPFDFRVALATARSKVAQTAADAQVKQQQMQRRLHLTDLATTAEEQQSFAGQAADASALFDAAQAQQAQAQMNLARTEVRSPVNGFVTNLLMRVGDYAHAGATNVQVIDTDSYWVDGYFEETKLARLCVGDRVEAKLMGYDKPIIGQIDTVTRGISVSDATPSTQGLPNVNAIYTWVRLAQRVPVRVRITHVPAGVPLISGLTATVTDRAGEPNANAPFLTRAYDNAANSINAVFNLEALRPGCIPPTTGATATPAIIPTADLPQQVTPMEIDPGLAPGLRVSPTGSRG
jgi:multidrug resistance efflux pump